MSRTRSLFERQQNILLHAQMHKPVQKGEAKSMQKTRFKDWVTKEVENKISERKAAAEAIEHRRSQLQEEGKRGSRSPSSDRYDPLADSDASSHNSDSPVKLHGADLQNTIKDQMRLNTEIRDENQKKINAGKSTFFFTIVVS